MEKEKNGAETQPADATQNNAALANWSLNLAILGLVLLFLLVVGAWQLSQLSLLPALVAIVLGHLAVHKIKKKPSEFIGKRQAVAGLVIGYVVVLFSVAVFITGSMIIRRETTKAVCLRNLRTLHALCQSYAMDHEGQLPKTLDDLRYFFQEESSSLPKFFFCPAAKDQGKPSYKIVLDGEVTSVPDKAVLIREIEANHGGKRGVVDALGHEEMVQD